MRKKFILLTMMLVLAILMIAPVYAAVTAVTVTVPTASATVKGTAFELNGTYTNNTREGDATTINVTVWQGANSGSVSNLTCYNSSVTVDRGRWNCKINLDQHNDNASMILNITVGNQTEVGASTTVTVENDNTDPVANFKSQERNARVSSSLAADCGDSTDNLDGALTYQMNLVKPGSVNASTVITASTGTFSGTDIDQTGTYTLYCTVQDNAPDAESSPSSANSHQASTTITITSTKLSPQQAEALGVAGPAKKGIDSKTLAVAAGAIMLLVYLGGGGVGGRRR